ncbi:MAG: hypothetical protein FWD03_00750 [Defluviitaleaceae bacterium]|nr:hypothetical protein [Defluviitaleaceae bacterium]
MRQKFFITITCILSLAFPLIIFAISNRLVAEFIPQQSNIKYETAPLLNPSDFGVLVEYTESEDGSISRTYAITEPEMIQKWMEANGEINPNNPVLAQEIQITDVIFPN